MRNSVSRLRWFCLLVGLLLVPFLGLQPASGEEADEEVIPMAPLDVTARYPLTPPEPRNISKPAYPEAARRQEEQGTVQLAVKVLADGNVGEVTVKKSSGSKALDEAATAEAKRWQFVPGPARAEEGRLVGRGPCAVSAQRDPMSVGTTGCDSVGPALCSR
jgi:TonB family protein